MNKRALNELLDSSLSNVSSLIDTSKVLGNPVKIDENKLIIPIARVSVGFGIGGSEFKNKDIKKEKNNLLFESGEETSLPFGGGSIGGLTINPEAFIIIENNKSEIIYVEKDKDLFDKTLSLIKDVIIKKKKTQK